MNTHKEEPKFKVGDKVTTFESDKVGEIVSIKETSTTPRYKVRIETYDHLIIFDEHELAPLEPTPPSQIEEDPKIVQIAPVFTDKFNYLFGLGAGGKPYYWDAKEEYWRYYDDQYGRHLDWELEQKFKEVNNTK